MTTAVAPSIRRTRTSSPTSIVSRASVRAVQTSPASFTRPVRSVIGVTERTGRVKLAGEVWTARTEALETIDVGEEVLVRRIEGATAVVMRVQQAGTAGRTNGSSSDQPSEENVL